jgi:hypothetical protein
MQRIWIAPLRFQKVATLTGLELNLQQFTNLKMLQRYVPSASISIHQHPSARVFEQKMVHLTAEHV